MPPPPLPRRRFYKTLTFWCGVVPCGGLLIIIGATIVSEIVGRYQWAQYQAEARQRGARLDILEFTMPPVPDAQNAAMAPVFIGASPARIAGETILKRSDTRKFPTTGGCDRQQLFPLIEWRDYFVNERWITSASDDPVADIRQALSQVDDTMLEVHDALQRPTLRLPVAWEKGMAANNPSTRTLQDIGYLHRLRAIAALAVGDRPVALRELQAIVNWRLALSREPSLIMGLIRQSFTTMAIETVWQGLATNGWAESDLREIEGSLAQIDPLADYRFSMDSQRGSVNRTFELLLNRNSTIYDDGSLGALTRKRSLAPFFKGWLRSNQFRMNRHIDSVLDRVDLEHRVIHRNRPLQYDPNHQRTLAVRMYYMFFYTMTPVYDSVQDRWAFGMARLDQCRTACALERFRLQHQRYPERLEELVPDFIPAVPHEPFSLDPVCYRIEPEGDGFTLYSRAVNGRDDGGIMTNSGAMLKRYKGMIPSHQQLDWVWTYPRSEP